MAAKYLIVLIPLHLVLLWVAGDRSIRAVALTAFLALVLAVAINQAIGLVVYSPRPFAVGLGHTLIEHRPSSSLPSNHATILFTYALVFWLVANRRIAVATALAGLAVAWSRIYLGVHYPLDMAAAVVTSVAAAFAARAVMARHGGAVLGRADALWNKVLGLARWPRALA